MKKLFTLVFGIALTAPLLSQAYIPDVYPHYGYNETEHICQIKQYDKDSEMREELIGEHWSLRDCRYNHPEIILYTGTGIILWVLLLGCIVLNNFVLKPRNKKKYTLEKKKVGALWDAFIIGSAIFILMLLLHYYDVPSTFYNYESDIDQIVYSILIHRHTPLLILQIYLVIMGITYIRNRT